MSQSDLLREINDRLQSGLRRNSIKSCSQWAEMYRRDKHGKPWSFRRFPWSKGMHDSTAQENVGQKGAQLAYSETMLSIGFYHNDIKKQDVLYVLPKQNPEASDFSKSRFDAAVRLSPRLTQLYSDVSNIGHKMAGTANFFIRGGQSESGLKSIPTAVVIADEIEHIPEEHIPLMKERMSGQFEKLFWSISTPTIHHHGINKLFLESSQDHFFFPCPRCSQHIELSFPECLEIVGDDPNSKRIHESYLKCPRCFGRLPQDLEAKIEMLAPGVWVASVEGKDKRGFYINQMYSTTISPGELAQSYLRAQTNPGDEQEFWNSKMGLPFEPLGSKVTNEQLELCKGGFTNAALKPNNGRIVTMGVDVGNKTNHIVIKEWTIGQRVGNDINALARPRILAFLSKREFEYLDTLMHDYQVNMCVIDAQPERREAFRFSQRFWGYVKMCYYGNGVSGKVIHEEKSELGEPKITVDRTSWLDQTLGRYRNQEISIPMDIPYEAKEHLTAISRVWKKDSLGNPTAAYFTPTGKADHFAHADNYAEIALPLATSMSQSYDMETIL